MAHHEGTSGAWIRELETYLLGGPGVHRRHEAVDLLRGLGLLTLAASR